jgi:hypothetical protein
MHTDCPKCGSSNACYQRNGPDIALHCLCGFFRVVYSELETVEVHHNGAEADVRLPKTGTHLRRTLFAVENLEEANTAEIAERLWDLGLHYSMSDVASYLTILRSKGLVESPVIRRGVAGGSTWTLTDAATDLLGTLQISNGVHICYRSG